MAATKGLKSPSRASWVAFYLLVFAALFGASLVAAVNAMMGQVPGLTVLSIYGSIVSLLFLPLLLRGKSVIRWVVFGLLLLGITELLFVPGTSRQRFVKDLRSIRPGMTIVQVEAIMGRYNSVPDAVPNTQRLPSGELILIRRDLAIYRHAGGDDAAFNADGGTVNFKNGRVVDVEFSPD